MSWTNDGLKKGRKEERKENGKKGRKEEANKHSKRVPLSNKVE
jgi:hypothetical protein